MQANGREADVLYCIVCHQRSHNKLPLYDARRCSRQDAQLLAQQQPAPPLSSNCCHACIPAWPPLPPPSPHQVISPRDVIGTVVVVERLQEVQDKTYDQPTVLIADKVRAPLPTALPGLGLAASKQPLPLVVHAYHTHLPHLHPTLPSLLSTHPLVPVPLFLSSKLPFLLHTHLHVPGKKESQENAVAQTTPCDVPARSPQC